MKRVPLHMGAALTAAGLLFALAAHAAGGPIEPLAPDPVVVWESPMPEKVYPRSPGLLRLEGGRLIFTMEYNQNGSRHMPNVKKTDDGKWYRGLLFVSDDGGKTFRKTHSFPLFQGRPFTAGGRLYYLGQYGDLGIIASGDRSETWTEVSWLTEGQDWHQAPCNVRYAHGKVYLVMERSVPPHLPHWPVQSHAPVVLSAPVDADLTKRESWTFSNEVPYRTLVSNIGPVNGTGVPFYVPGPTKAAKRLRHSRPMAPPGWLETHLLTFPDPDHLWHDPENRTMYLYARAHTGRTNLAAIAKAVEAPDGTITVGPVKAPSGKSMLYVPLPGGHLKFYILYDEPSQRYWLVSNQSTDSMTKPSALPKSRYMLPDNERDRLVLHFSKNGMDWCFAGLVDKTGKDRQPRSYPSMVVDGDDLIIVARSGDEESKNAHDGNIVTLHRIENFRGLVY